MTCNYPFVNRCYKSNKPWKNSILRHFTALNVAENDDLSV